MVSVAIDGPAGAGKSTIAKAVSERLGFTYVDTGALYRAIGLHMLNLGIDLKNDELICSALSGLKINLIFKDGVQQVILCGEDVSDLIRTPSVSMAASQISQNQEVRKFLLNLQREIALKSNVLMDGRDIGTVVLPNADVKIFLTASAEARARRRYEELIKKGIKDSYEKVLSDIKLRDYYDSHREIAPLIPAKDSVIIDTTKYTLEESIDKIENVIKERLVWNKKDGFMN